MRLRHCKAHRVMAVPRQLSLAKRCARYADGHGRAKICGGGTKPVAFVHASATAAPSGCEAATCVVP